ncbi:zinc finger protein ZFP2-like isoform X1 [Condylostylus longicornis]|uniref:zinc finger protein ZFP2-like isoform X1 n=1 Tax=Condylostylus longicornis TaxID=2530218 RepID=UPI00244DADA1|nr:zinc finger protein ZFP2-like isoform X1 [Condylostylus longicornis]
MSHKLICRICMNFQETINLKNLNSHSEENDISLSEIFYKVTNIDLRKTLFYGKICVPCCDELISCFKFITKCIEADEILRSDSQLNFCIKIKEDDDIDKFKVNVEEIWKKESSSGYIEKCGDYFKCLSCNKYFASETGVNKHVGQCLSGSNILSTKKDFYEDEKGVKTITLDEKQDENMGREVSDDSIELPDPKNKRKSEYICTYCKKKFDRSNRLTRHLSVHNSENKPFECQICKYRFVSKKALLTHQIKHNEICQKTSEKDSELRINKCPNCPRKFLKKESLASHMRVHKEGFQTAKPLQKSYNCHSCSKSFLSISSFIRHILEHQGLTDFKCIICVKEHKNKEELIQHLKWHENRKIFECEICKKAYNQVNKLHNHVKINHAEENRLLLCNVCGNSFRSASYLKQHMRIHTGEKPIACSECPAKFSSRAGLSSHMLTHTKIKAFSCDICKSTFTKKHSLKKHNRIHTGEKPYECQTCFARCDQFIDISQHGYRNSDNKSKVTIKWLVWEEKPISDMQQSRENQFNGYECHYHGYPTCLPHNLNNSLHNNKNDALNTRFKSSYVLKRHNLTHTGEKPYACDYCERAFAQKNDLIKHLKIHLGENIYKCDICMDSFRLQYELRDHLYEHYRKQKETNI